MALRCDWLVLCERVIEDSQTGNLTLVNCLDQVQAWSIPSTLPGFGFAARFSRDTFEVEEEGTYQFRLMRHGGSGEDMLVVETSGTLDADALCIRVFFNFAVLRLFAEETVTFRIDWRQAGQRWRHGPRVPLRVTLYPQETRDSLAAELLRLRTELTGDGAS